MDKAKINTSNGTVTINGVNPTLKAVSLFTDSDRTTAYGGADITVEGGSAAAQTLYAKAVSAKGTVLTTNAGITWSVSPAGQGVGITNEGVISIGAKATAGSYTVTATPNGSAVLGSAVSSTTNISVKHSPSVLDSVELYKDAVKLTGDSDTVIIPSGTTDNTYTYSVKAYDQFGTDITSTITPVWTFTTGNDNVIFNNGTVTVKHGATKDSTYTLKASVTKEEVTKETQTVTITAKDIEITKPTVTIASNLTYGRTWGDYVTLSGGSASLNGTNVPGSFSVENATTKPSVGANQTVNILFNSTDGKYTNIVADTKTVSIVQKEIGISWGTTSFTYDGTVKAPTATATGLISGDVCTITVTGGQIDAGSNYTATAASLSNANYKLPAANTTTFTIAKANLSAADFDITAPTNKTYDGAAAVVTAPVAKAEITGSGTVTVTYAKGTSAASTTAPTDAGTYAVKFNVAAGTNYNAATGLTIGSLTIAQKGVTITGLTAENKAYDESTGATAAGTAEIVGKVGTDDVTVVPGSASFSDQYAGTGKTVTFANYSLGGTKAGNYKLTAQPAAVTADITAAAQTLTLPASAVSLAKNGNTLDLRTLVSGNKGDLSFAIASGDGATLGTDGYTLTSGDTAEKTLTITVNAAAKNLGGTDAYEYTATSGTITVNIVNKLNADVSISGNATVEKTYGDAAFTLTASAATPGSAAGTWTWTSSDQTVATVAGTGTSATVTILKNGTANINAKYESATHIGEATAALTVAQRTVSISWAGNAERAYNGEASNVTATITNKVGNDDVALTVTGGTETNARDTAYTASAALSGTDADKYALPADPTTTYKINKAKLTGEPKYDTISESDKTLADAHIAVNTAWPAGAVVWDDGNDTVVERGSSYGWTFTPSDATNYEVLTGSIILWRKPSSGSSVPSGTSTQAVVINSDEAADQTEDQTDDQTEDQTSDDPTASWTEEDKAAAEHAATLYDDVKADYWAAPAIDYTTENGIFKGTSERKFSPTAAATREQVMTVLARYSGLEGATVEEGVKWAVENEISDGTMRLSPITREQFVTMLYRLIQNNGGGFTGAWSFLLESSDADKISDWADEAMHYAVMEGIVTGYTDGTLRPQDNITRAQMAVIMERLDKLEIL